MGRPSSARLHTKLVLWLMITPRRWTRTPRRGGLPTSVWFSTGRVVRPRFASVILYTGAELDDARAAEVTREFFAMTRRETAQFQVSRRERSQRADHPRRFSNQCWA